MRLLHGEELRETGAGAPRPGASPRHARRDVVALHGVRIVVLSERPVDGRGGGARADNASDDAAQRADAAQRNGRRGPGESSNMLGGASQIVSMIRVKCNGK